MLLRWPNDARLLVLKKLLDWVLSSIFYNKSLASIIEMETAAATFSEPYLAFV